MQYRTLGRTGISVSEIGLGTEYLNGQSSETVSSVIHKATDRGINYMDVLFSFPEYRTNIVNDKNRNYGEHKDFLNRN